MLFVKIQVILLLLLGFNSSISFATKWLIANPSFDSEASWSDSLPCSLDEIIFPENYDAVLPLPKEIESSGFVLPRDGAILFNQDSTIDFGAEPKKRQCDNDDRKAYLKQPSIRKWFDPHSWRTTTDMTKNMAVSHMERVPCNNESVVIQRNGPLSIDLEFVPYLRIGQLSLAGSIISKDYFKNLLNTDIGQILFKNSLDVKVEYYRDDVCGCHKNYKKFVEPICHNVYEDCERPHCLSPILPLESCCSQCGAMLNFQMSRCDDGNLHRLSKLISTAISDQNLGNELDFHVSYVGTNILQAVIVDRDGYNEKSVAFARYLNSTIKWNKVLTPLEVAMHFSGRPYNGAVTFGSILLIILCISFVAYVGLVIFSHYAPDNHYVRMIPAWVLEPRRWRELLIRSPFVFARFHNAGMASAAEEHVENLTMRFNTRSGAMRECAFDNPMFDESSKRNEEQSEISAETQSLESDNVVSSAQGGKLEEQELTEIRLESCTDESDVEESKE